MATTIFYLSIKAVSAAFILYKVWNIIFGQRMHDFWNVLHNWARIARIRLWKYRKKRMAENARKARRKARMQKPLSPKELHVEKPAQPERLSTSEIEAMYEKLAKRYDDKPKDEPPQLLIDENPKPKIKPVAFDDPNEVMGKSNIIYYEDLEVACKTPTSSLELKEAELPVDEDINPEDVEDYCVQQKRLSKDDMQELMSSESIPDPEFSGACTFEELGNVADVLLNKTNDKDKDKVIDATETLYMLKDSDIYHFFSTSVSMEKQMAKLMKDNLDVSGRPLNGKQTQRTAVDWNKFM